MEASHHAYYIEGSPADFARYQEAVHPLWSAHYERFGIDEARELTTRASLKNYLEQARYLVAASSMTSEAQQALLKLFEEPQSGTVFIVLLPHGVLLPTLRSRMLPYTEVLSELPIGKNDDAVIFLRASGKERSDYIAKLLKDDEGVKDAALALVNRMETLLAPKVGEPIVREALSDLAMTRDYLRDRSPSIKMLLEHLAIALPRLP